MVLWLIYSLTLHAVHLGSISTEDVGSWAMLMTIGIATLQVLCQGARLFVHRGVEGTERSASRCVVRWMAEWLREKEC